MRLLITLCLWTALLMQHTGAGAQVTPVHDTLYGFDPILYNGRHYTYQVPRNSEGSPYYYSGFQPGSVVIRDIYYDGIDLNLDLLNQLLVMKYQNHEGATVILEIPDTWLTSARIGQDSFEPLTREDGKHIFSQVIGSGVVKIRYFLRRDLKLDNGYGSPVFIFSKVLREQNVDIRGIRFPFRNNSTFLKAFKEPVKQTISNYLKNNKIKVSKASISDMESLVDFCQKQLQP